MNKKLVLFISLMALLVLSLPVMAQDDAPQEPIPVSATFSYTWESPQVAVTNTYMVQDGIEQEAWSGDFEGEATAIWRVISHTDEPVVDGWLQINFEGRILGEYDGTLTILLNGTYPFSAMESPLPGQWSGEWAIVAGTGELANVHGHGVWWGAGNVANDPDPGPDIALEGEIVFMEPTTSE